MNVMSCKTGKNFGNSNILRQRTPIYTSIDHIGQLLLQYNGTYQNALPFHASIQVKTISSNQSIISKEGKCESTWTTAKYHRRLWKMLWKFRSNNSFLNSNSQRWNNIQSGNHNGPNIVKCKASTILRRYRDYFPKFYFYERETADDLSVEEVSCWASVCIWFPKIISLDRKYSLPSSNFRANVEDLGIQLQFSRIQSHNVIGKGNRYQYPRRWIFSVLLSPEPSLDDRLKLTIAIKAMNDTMNQTA